MAEKSVIAKFATTVITGTNAQIVIKKFGNSELMKKQYKKEDKEGEVKFA